MQQNNMQGTRKKITLAEQIDLTGTKPATMLFNGKEFRYMRRDGWKGVYVDLAKELYHIAPQEMRELAASQREFLISDEPVCWAVGNREFAENYEPEWWVRVGENVFIYTKNNTNAKIKRMRWLLEAFKQNLAEITIILY